MGTTPASRFFRRNFPDLFETVLAHIEELPRSRQRTQARVISRWSADRASPVFEWGWKPNTPPSELKSYASTAVESSLHFLALRGVWNCHLVWAELRTAHARGEELMDLARCAPNSALLVEVHRALGTTLLFLGELTAARRDLEQGMALYDPQQHRALALRYGADSGIVCRLFAGWVLWLLGYPDQALHTIDDALTQAARLSAHLYARLCPEPHSARAYVPS